MSIRSLAAGLLLLAAGAAYADIPPPPTPGPTPKTSARARAGRLRIALIRNGDRAQLHIPGGVAPAAGSTSLAPGGSGFQTAVAGGLLSLSIALGGFWLLRRRRWSPAGAGVAGALLLLGGGGVTAAFANVAPSRPRPGPPPAVRVPLSLQAAPGSGDEVTLFISPNDLSQMTGGYIPGAGLNPPPGSAAPGPGGPTTSGAAPASKR